MTPHPVETSRAIALELETVGGFARRHAAALCAVGLGLLLLAWPVLVELAGEWSRDPELSHGFLVPAVAAAIVYSRRRELGVLEAKPSNAGLAFFLASLALFAFAYFERRPIFARLGVVGMITGAAWHVFGGRLVAAARFPLFFLCFAVPPPGSILRPLRLGLKEIATRLSADSLGALGLDVVQEGNVLVLGGRQLEVADACSGIRSLMALAAVAALFAYLSRSGPAKGALLVASVVPVTILVNVFRIAVVALAASRFEIDLTTGIVHDALGLALFAASLGLLYACWKFYDWLFRRPVRSESGAAAR